MRAEGERTLVGRGIGEVSDGGGLDHVADNEFFHSLVLGDQRAARLAEHPLHLRPREASQPCSEECLRSLPFHPSYCRENLLPTFPRAFGGLFRPEFLRFFTIASEVWNYRGGKKVFVENGFTNKNVFNMDETAVFWRRFRSTSILDHDRAGTAPPAARWTVILCANGNESKRFRPYFIQTQERCRHWGSWRPSKIDIEWRRRMSGWMDCIIFWDRLRTFNTLVAKEIGEKVILIMANAPQRKPPDGYEKLDYGNGLHGFTFGNVMIIYLPPNYTSHIQPLDQGTIRAASGSEQNWSEVDQLKYSRRTATMVMSLSLCPLHRIGMPAKHCLPAMPQPPRSTKSARDTHPLSITER